MPIVIVAALILTVACGSSHQPNEGDGSYPSSGSVTGGAGAGGMSTGTGAIVSIGGVSGVNSSGGAAAADGAASGGIIEVGGSHASAGGAISVGLASGGRGISEGVGGRIATGSGGESVAQASGGSPGDGSGDQSSNMYTPCPDSGPFKILPLGDSITVGVGSESVGGGGYRPELFRLAMDGGYDLTFTGAQTSKGPMSVAGVSFPQMHGGISGQVIAEIGARIPAPELSDAPHIILVHAGTNDLTFSPEGAEGRFIDLIDKLLQEAPDSLLVVSSIIPMSFYDVGRFNQPIPAIVEERAQNGAHIVFVDHFEGYPLNELGDQVHPNVAGYLRMARNWFKAIEGYLPRH